MIWQVHLIQIHKHSGGWPQKPLMKLFHPWFKCFLRRCFWMWCNLSCVNVQISDVTRYAACIRIQKDAVNSLSMWSGDALYFMPYNATLWWSGHHLQPSASSEHCLNYHDTFCYNKTNPRHRFQQSKLQTWYWWNNHWDTVKNDQRWSILILYCLVTFGFSKIWLFNKKMKIFN